MTSQEFCKQLRSFLSRESETPQEDFSTNLIEAMQTREMSQSDLAREMGVTRQYISEIINYHLPATKTVESLANALSISPAALLRVRKFREDKGNPDTRTVKVVVEMPISQLQALMEEILRNG